MYGKIFSAASLLVCASLCGCNEYVTPGRGADMSAMGLQRDAANAQSPGIIRQELDKKPLAQFPAVIAVARIQSPGYRSESAESWGDGKFSLMTNRDIEDDVTIARLIALPQVRGIAPITKMVLSPTLESDETLRNAAARLQADMLLVYTIDTQFYSKDAAVPLTLFTLGLAPDQQLHVVSTASAVLMDTRNGYIFSVTETTSRDDDLTLGIFNEVDMDRMRQKTEGAAFKEMVDQFVAKWPAVLAASATASR